MRLQLKTSKFQSQLDQIQRRLKQLDGLKRLFVSQIYQSCQSLSKYCKKVTLHLRDMEETVCQLAVNDSSKESEGGLATLCRSYQQLFLRIQSRCTHNMKNVERLSQSVENEKFTKKCKYFLKERKQYENLFKDYQNQCQNYELKCKNLKQQIQANKKYQSPLYFYNVQLAFDPLKTLSDIYSACQSREMQISTRNSTLYERRKWLGQNLRELMQICVSILHGHLADLLQIINGVLIQDEELDEEDSHSNDISVDNTFLVFYQTEVEMAVGRKMKEMKYSEQLKEVDFLQIKRINNLIQTKKQLIMESVKLQAKIIHDLGKEKDLYQEFRSAYFSKKQTKIHPESLRTFLGQRVSMIGLECFNLILNFHKNLQKNYRSMEEMEIKLTKIVQTKTQALGKFSHKSQKILNQMKQMDKSQRDLWIKSIKSLAIAIDELQQAQNYMDKLFMRYMTDHLNLLPSMTYSHVPPQSLKFNIDHEVIFLMRHDKFYEIFFSQEMDIAREPVKSLIDLQGYQQVKGILQRKQRKMENYITKNKCCFGRRQFFIDKTQTKAVFSCKLTYEEIVIQGKMHIFLTSLLFTQNALSPYSKIHQFQLPSCDIDSIRLITPADNEQIQIKTSFGSLLISSESLQDILESMEHWFGIPVKKCRDNDYKVEIVSNSLRKQIISRYEIKENDMDNSSKVSSQTELKDVKYSKKTSSVECSRSRQSNKSNKSNKSKNNDNDNGILRKLTKKWKKLIFFSQNFQLVQNGSEDQEANPTIKQYTFQSKHLKMRVKEYMKIINQQRLDELLVIYDWQLRFPSPLPPCSKVQQIHIQLASQHLVKIQITHGKGFDHPLLILNRFDLQVKEMNEKICNFITNATLRQGQLIQLTEEDEFLSINSDNIALQ